MSKEAVRVLNRKDVHVGGQNLPDLGVVKGFEKRKTVAAKGNEKSMTSLPGAQVLVQLDTPLQVTSLRSSASESPHGNDSWRKSGSCIKECCVGPTQFPDCPPRVNSLEGTNADLQVTSLATSTPKTEKMVSGDTNVEDCCVRISVVRSCKEVNGAKDIVLTDLSISSVRIDRRIRDATVYDRCKESETELPCCGSVTNNACPCR